MEVGSGRVRWRSVQRQDEAGVTDRRKTLTELADQVGMTLANLSILKTGNARAVRFSTLEAICEALSCQPGDLLRFEPEHAERDRPAAASGRSASR